MLEHLQSVFMHTAWSTLAQNHPVQCEYSDYTIPQQCFYDYVLH